MLVPSKRERTQRSQSQACCSRAMWPCCDYTSSDDDEHNTDNNFLLLFADVDITPTLLARLSEIDVLRIAPHLILSHHLLMLCSNPCSEAWCNSCPNSGHNGLVTCTAPVERNSHSSDRTVTL